LEIMDILHIPNEFWINLIWKSTWNINIKN
jgi:hypothetical protein